jgi:type II secretory pathway pseudopilin PulG
MKNRIIKSENQIKGFGIIEVLVAISLLAILGVGVSSLITGAMKSQRGIQAKDQQREMTSEIRSLLSNKTACLNTFGALTTAGGVVTTIKDASLPSGVVKYTVGANDKTEMLTFVEFGLSNFIVPDPLIPTSGNMDFKIKISKVGDTGSVKSIKPDTITLKIKKNASNTITECFSIGTQSDGLWQISTVNSNDIFYSAGNVGIGNANPTERLVVSGNISATAFLYTSDVKFKKNITDLTEGLDFINKMRPVRYVWKSNGQSDIGFIAQDIEKIAPELTSTDSDGTKKIDYAKMVTILVRAIQEQQVQIEELQKNKK